uniref:C2H2-type domain-containing protein n=1 Tax=Chromera velia CCMP2878 TaxID=1169474 RepID=A0A0G4HN64_9ALVE|eukprot:Cvel_29422.t1-p1 / transcript=Cvel_29422.t1 / gene=Cvel_29422 / organism=Chromera_velia_CCMP2878 / gene_product=Putative uncharacterized transposon-derived protein, putative / transcript_product=Putative uncharacterized transposon-derived protein, putative / location=Cvel_scaffold4018:3015-4262(+) / protein_length=416 / sequence_SO=supercontig / SO=protein_coding / is_pseudo=false
MGFGRGMCLGLSFFLPFFEAVIEEALEGWEGGVKVEVDFTQPISSKKPSKSFSFVMKVTDLKFADNLGAPDPSEQRMQELADRLQAACKRWSLQISIKKTEILVQPVAGEKRHTGNLRPSPISINGQPLQEVQEFRYLGGMISNDGSLDPEINLRIQRAGMVWGRLQGEVWQKGGLIAQTKMHLFRGAVLPALLYRAETWAVQKDQVYRLESWCMARARQILRQPRTERMPDAAIRRVLGLSPIESLIRKARLRWLGHVGRMGKERLPRQLLFGHLAGDRPVGRPLLRWTDCVLSDFRQLGINEAEWQSLAANREEWRKLVQRGVKEVEERQREEKEEKRAVRKGKKEGDFRCGAEGCKRSFLSERGLRIHMSRIYGKQPAKPPYVKKEITKQGRVSEKGSLVLGCHVKQILAKYR